MMIEKDLTLDLRHCLELAAAGYPGESLETVTVETVALTGVAIAGPTTGLTGRTDTFTATVEPPTGTEPVTYAWSPDPQAGQGTRRTSVPQKGQKLRFPRSGSSARR